MQVDGRSLHHQVGRCVRERRQQLHMSQTQLAHTCGVLRTTVANIEAGRQRIPLETLYKLAAGLDVPVCDLLPSREDVGASVAVAVEVDGELMRLSPKAAAFLRQVRGEGEGTDAGS